MPDAQSRWFYIVRQLQVAGRVSTKVAGNRLLLSVTGRSERCRSGSEIPGAGLYQRQGAERRSRGVEGRGIRDELMASTWFAPFLCSPHNHRMQQFPTIRLAIPTRVAAPFDQLQAGWLKVLILDIRSMTAGKRCSRH